MAGMLPRFKPAVSSLFRLGVPRSFVLGSRRVATAGLTRAQEVAGQANQKDYYDQSSHYDLIFKSDNIRLGYFPHLAEGSRSSHELNITESGYALTHHMMTLMQLTPESTVLDMGCGKGQACVDVARTAGCSVVGVDLSGTNIARANELKSLNPDLRLDFLEGSITDLPSKLKSSKFSHIMTVQAWVHVHSDLDAVLAEARSVLEPGGLVVVEDFCSNDRGIVTEQAMQHFYKRLHFDKVLGPAEWQRKAETAGFSVEHVEDLKDHMAQSYRLMAQAAGDLEILSADGTPLQENYRNTVDIIDKGEVTMLLAVLKLPG